MIAIANKIAKSVRAVFVRIDLYSVNNRVYFSEVTFSPNSGVIPFIPKEADSNIGELIDLERVNQ